MRCFFVCTIVAAGLAHLAATGSAASAAEKLKVLIIDGQNNHDWKATTPLLVDMLEKSGRFTTTVATSPAKGADMSAFLPKFDDYDVVMSNYNGEPWSKETQKALVDYIHGGKGFVVVHAANNSFPAWPEYNEIIGLGGWENRNEKWGPYVYYKGNELVRDETPGGCGHHGPQHEYVVQTRNAEHPIMKGLPAKWLHTKDELYDTLRGPAKNLTVLATAYSDPKFAGTDRDEPMLMTLSYGDGRVFHTALGHADYSMNCIGFVTTLLRGTEWAASGEVTIPVPKDFPTDEKTSSLKK